MKLLFALIAAFLTISTFFPDDAEAARRLGGGRSYGTQRSVTPPAQRAAPSQQQGAQQATPPQTQPQTGNRWLGPLAGLAAGLGLGYLFSQGGFGGAFAAILIALLAGFVVFALLKILMRPRSGSQPMQYAGPDRAPIERMPMERAPAQFTPSVVPAASAQPASVPAGFDTTGFLKQAKLNFIRLQDANDRRNLDALREVMTPAMFDAILADLAPNAGPQHTDVVSLEAELLEVVTEGDKHWASVRFSGMIRDGGEAEPFTEVWHLEKPVSGGSGWLLAGIQQTA